MSRTTAPNVASSGSTRNDGCPTTDSVRIGASPHKVAAARSQLAQGLAQRFHGAGRIRAAHAEDHLVDAGGGERGGLVGQLPRVGIGRPDEVGGAVDLGGIATEALAVPDEGVVLLLPLGDGLVEATVPLLGPAGGDGQGALLAAAADQQGRMGLLDGLGFAAGFG